MRRHVREQRVRVVRIILRSACTIPLISESLQEVMQRHTPDNTRLQDASHEQRQNCDKIKVAVCSPRSRRSPEDRAVRRQLFLWRREHMCSVKLSASVPHDRRQEVPGRVRVQEFGVKCGIAVCFPCASGRHTPGTEAFNGLSSSSPPAHLLLFNPLHHHTVTFKIKGRHRKTTAVGNVVKYHRRPWSAADPRL